MIVHKIKVHGAEWEFPRRLVFGGEKEYNKCRSFEGGVDFLLKGTRHSSGTDENGVGGGSAQASQSTPDR